MRELSFHRWALRVPSSMTNRVFDDHPEEEAGLALAFLADGEVVEPVPEEEDGEGDGGVEGDVDADEGVGVGVRAGAALVEVGDRQGDEDAKGHEPVEHVPDGKGVQGVLISYPWRDVEPDVAYFGSLTKGTPVRVEGAQDEVEQHGNGHEAEDEGERLSERRYSYASMPRAVPAARPG